MTTVKIIGTIHKTTKLFSHGKLFNAIDDFKADILGLEIRSQDLEEPIDYLMGYYPSEMVKTLERYNDKLHVYGFDWRGEAIENRPIECWLTETPTLRSVALSNPIFNGLIKERELIMKNLLDIYSLETGQQEFDKINVNNIKEKINKLLEEYGHNELLSYTLKRENKIKLNVIDIIRKNEGKRVLFLTGLTHRKQLVHHVESRLGIKVL